MTTTVLALQQPSRPVSLPIPAKQTRGLKYSAVGVGFQAVQEVGRKWAAVAERVPGRTDMSCRERYMNVLDPSLRKGAWTAEEDWRLQEGVDACRAVFPRISWAYVARRVPGRTDSMCYIRYQRTVSKYRLPPRAPFFLEGSPGLGGRAVVSVSRPRWFCLPSDKMPAV